MSAIISPDVTLAQALLVIVAEHFERDSDQLGLSDHFIDDLGADSLSMAGLMVTIEEQLGIEIPAQAVRQCTTIRGTVEVLLRHQETVLQSA